MSGFKPGKKNPGRVTVDGDSHREILVFCHRHRHRNRLRFFFHRHRQKFFFFHRHRHRQEIFFHRHRHRHPVQRWFDRSFSKKEEAVYKWDSTPWWEHVVTTEILEDRIFEPLALHYYKIATIIPAEGVVEGFFSIAGFIFDGRRYRLDAESLQTICLQYLWRHLENGS